MADDTLEHVRGSPSYSAITRAVKLSDTCSTNR